jgi:hypothetical protein
LCNLLQSKVSCCLHMYMYTFFGDTICLRTNQKMIKVVTLIDSHVVLTYDCWHCFLVFNIWMSHALEMTINFYCFGNDNKFVFHLPNHLIFTQNFVYPTLFPSVPPPAINNDRSVRDRQYLWGGGGGKRKGLVEPKFEWLKGGVNEKHNNNNSRVE